MTTSELQSEKILADFSVDRTGTLPERTYKYATRLQEAFADNKSELKKLKFEVEYEITRNKYWLAILGVVGFFSIINLSSFPLNWLVAIAQFLFLFCFLGLILKTALEIQKQIALLFVIKIAIIPQPPLLDLTREEIIEQL